MSSKQISKLSVLIVFIFLLLAISIIGFNRKDDILYPLTVISDKESTSFSKYVFKDYSDNILNNGVKAAIDKSTSTVYVSVNEGQLSDGDFLAGLLDLSASDEMFFGVFDADRIEAMRKNQPLKMIIAEKDSDEYMQYDLILTTIPVINLDGGNIGEDSQGRDLNGGDFSIWSAEESLPLQTSSVHWHVRGGSSSKYDKTSFKLSFKKRYEDNDMTFLDMGSDDEWILNAMVVDDTKVREKFAMDIWDQMQKTNKYGVKMSIGEYVEVVINGKYQGLYLLQRQINEKYLELDDDAILLRGVDSWTPASADEAYAIKYSIGMTDKEIYDKMNGLFTMTDFSLLDIDNWVDVSLLIQFGRMYDNRWLKNSYYTVNYNDDGKICIILWDTDLSFGIDWSGNGFTYAFSPYVGITRAELSELLLKSPDITRLLAERWKELRCEVLKYDNLLSLLEKHKEKIYSSGAILRDDDTNGMIHDGEDNYDNLQAYVQEQLRLMDELYLEK